MKKFTLLSLLMIFSIAIFAQSNLKNTNVLSSVKVDKVVNNLKSSKAVIDSLHYDAANNDGIGTGAAADFGIYAFHSAASLAGHNSVGNTITSVKFYINGVADVTGTELRIYSDQGVTLLYSQVWTAIEGWNEVVLTTPFAIPTTDIYIGCFLNASGGYPAGCDGATTPNPNGNWMDFSGWAHMDEISATLTFNWNIRAMVDGIVPPNPVAGCTPLAWNAGDIETATSATSGTFTLTNSAGGTLTVTSATDLSATTFSTTFVAGSVSLTTGQTYDFTFDFDPTVAGTFNETFSIVTNGGTVDITLDGMAHDPFGDMLGDFENISAFDIVFPGWVQHDVDAGATYTITGITYNNAGYTGSFQAFNPSLTTPSMATDAAIQPHGGAQFGACFASTTPPNDDWLVTPQHTVVAGDDVGMWVRSYTDAYGLEQYEVFISTATSDIADFTTSLSGGVLAADTIWTNVVYDLSAYVGQDVYVGIHCTTNDAFIFMIDDIVFGELVGISDAKAEIFSMFPNPTTGTLNITNAENADVVVYNMLGEVVLSVNNITRTIDISELAEGTYVVKVVTENNVSTQKVNLLK